jgi:hypothetical protein
LSDIYKGAAPFFVVIVLFVIVVVLAKRDDRRARLKDANEEHRPTPNNHTGANDGHETVSSPHPDTEEWNPEKKAHKRKELAYWRRQTGISIATLILTLFAVAGAIASAIFASRAVDQATIAATATVNQSRTLEDTEKRQLRPYVNIAPGALYNSNAAIPGATPEWHIPIEVENNGATQTKGAIGVLWCTTDDFATDDPMKKPGYRPRDFLALSKNPGQVLASTRPINSLRHNNPIPFIFMSQLRLSIQIPSLTKPSILPNFVSSLATSKATFPSQTASAFRPKFVISTIALMMSAPKRILIISAATCLSCEWDLRL